MAWTDDKEAAHQTIRADLAEERAAKLQAENGRLRAEEQKALAERDRAQYEVRQLREERDSFQRVGIEAGLEVERLRAEWDQRERFIERYLDDAIQTWRRKRADGDPLAECYVDAFQSVRVSLLGEALKGGGE
jgi:hypothetical protein